MVHSSEDVGTDIIGYLARHEAKSLLRFSTCGSVDDGKSTLIGRMLYESKLIFEDQLAAIERDSKTMGTQEDDIDLALLVDGLASEREQGITIDVAYRYFSTDKRKFIVADTPGHEQYTRNMATGASTADLAIILVDASKGVLTQTRRHSMIASLLGIQNVVLAVNKMDLVGYDEATFNRIVQRYLDVATELGEGRLPFEVTAIPVSALIGDNVVERSANMAWYGGPPLLTHLEDVPVGTFETAGTFRFPVQWVNRPSPDFRGFSGLVVRGAVRPGDAVRIQPSGRNTTVKSIVTHDGDLEEAVAGQSVTLTLTDEVDVSRGDLIAAASEPAETADQFRCTVLWMTDAPLLPGRPYVLKIGPKTVQATVTSLRHRINVDTFEHVAAKNIELNMIAVVNVALDQRIAFDPYNTCRDTGGFILIDRLTNNTVGMGVIQFALRRSANIHWQAMDVNREVRASMKAQKPIVLWFTGLSGSGKSTIANVLERKLTALGRHTYLLDGDNVRHGLNKDLGFTAADRVENIRRVAEVAKLMTDAGLIVLAAFISPFRAERRMARELFEDGMFVEIFVDTPLEVAEGRDVKGLYKKARAGLLKNFTGIDSPYEEPENPEVRINTVALTVEEAADELFDFLAKTGVFGPR